MFYCANCWTSSPQGILPLLYRDKSTIWSFSLKSKYPTRAQPALKPQVYLFSWKTILLLVSINCVSKRLQGFFWNNLPERQISSQTSFRGFFTSFLLKQVTEVSASFCKRCIWYKNSHLYYRSVTTVDSTEQRAVLPDHNCLCLKQ